MFLGVFNMVAFERIKSGIPQLDETLDNIRLGDNVVWQVSNLDEFLYFVKPFVKQAQEDNVTELKFIMWTRTSSLNLLLWKFITSLQKRVGMLFMYLTVCLIYRLHGLPI